MTLTEILLFHRWKAEIFNMKEINSRATNPGIEVSFFIDDVHGHSNVLSP